MTKALSTCLALLVTSSITLGVFGEEGGDEAAVRAAVLDYVEGVYDVDPSRIERSVHPELAKRGFGRDKETKGYYEVPMTFEGLVRLAAGYNKDGHIPQDAPKEVILYEVLDKTASVKLVAEWGIDYMHLAKYEGQWKIVNVLWQAHPE
ncbi:MAG: nuclear transport factor 2 family protein [Acidobacteriota bacterium]